MANRKPFTAFRRYLFICLASSLFPVPSLLADSAHQWHCEANNTDSWSCLQEEVSGRSFMRPEKTQRHIPATPEEPRVTLTRNLDWVPMEQLSEEEQALARDNCCGAYIEPARDYVDADLPPEQAPLRVGATTTEAQGDVATLEGDVQLSQGFRQVRSNRATVDRQQHTVELEGNITFREPGLLLTSDKAKVNFESGELDVAKVAFVLHRAGVRGEAAQLSRPEENHIYIDNASYTTCEPGNDTWMLKASSVDIDTARSIATARHVRLNVHDWPVLYIPWIRYPTANNRATGLLFPNILTGNDNGLDYAQPIYLNLAPNYDATVTPRLIQERGAMAEIELRHLSHWTETAFSSGYLWDDEGGSQADTAYVGSDRWIVNLDHRGGFGSNWSSLIDYTDVSDNDYFLDIDSATLQVSSLSHLNQQIKLGYSTSHWELSIQGQEFETIIDNGLEQYKQLPRIDAKGHYRLTPDLVLNLRQHYVQFDHSEDNIQVLGPRLPFTVDTDNTAITGSRLRANYSLAWEREWLWGFFSPRIIAKYIGYDLDNPLLNQTDDQPSVFVPTAALDTGLFFERETPWFEGYVQTFEPRVFYLNSKYEDQSALPNFDTSELTFSYQQLFRDDRFSGGDRIGDTEQATFGVTTRLIDQRSGRERLRLSIGQIFYMDDRRITLSPQIQAITTQSSDIAAEFAASYRNWRLQADLLTSEDEGRINKGSVALRYNNSDDSILNLSYRYTRRDALDFTSQLVRADIDQMDLSLAFPIADNWRLLGRYNQDLRTHQELEIFTGIEYSSCCWRASVVARRWIERDDHFIIGSQDLGHNNGIFFQIQFRGLAGTGKRVDDILAEGIYGYQTPEN